MDPPKDSSAYFKSLTTEAPLIYGDHGIAPAKLDLPNSDLNDPELIAAGKDFVKRHFYSVMLAHLISLMWVFTFKPGRAVLLRTGESHDKDAALKRYLSTVLHIKLWYESDFIERSARGSQDIYSVRKMHSAAAKNYAKTKPPVMPELTAQQAEILKSVHAEMAHHPEDVSLKSILTEDPEVPMSQFDMVVTQFCFIGFILLMPTTFGINKVDKKGMDGFLHLWAIFGRQLGIEDRFNLGIHYKKCGGDLEDFWRIYRDIFLPNLKNADETAFVMWDSLIYGCSKYVRQLRLLPMIKFMVVQGAGAGCDKGCLKGVMGWRDNFSYKFLVFATKRLGKWKLTRNGRNGAIRLSFFRAQRKFLPKWHGPSACPQANVV